MSKPDRCTACARILEDVAYSRNGQAVCYWCHVGVTSGEMLEKALEEKVRTNKLFRCLDCNEALPKESLFSFDGKHICGACKNKTLPNVATTPTTTVDGRPFTVSKRSPTSYVCGACGDKSDLHVCYPKVIAGLKSDPGFRQFMDQQIDAALRRVPWKAKI